MYLIWSSFWVGASQFIVNSFNPDSTLKLCGGQGVSNGGSDIAVA